MGNKSRHDRTDCFDKVFVDLFGLMTHYGSQTVHEGKNICLSIH